MTLPATPIAAGRTAEIYPWENDCVLKLTRAQFSAQLADQEWQRLGTVWKLGAPVPRPVELVEVEGRRGVVFERLHGPTLVQTVQRAPWRLFEIARLLGRLQAELHRLATPDFPSLHQRVVWNLGQTNLLSQQHKEAILDLLRQLPDEDTLCHCDFHLENILLTDQGPRVIDWEGCLHGDPAGDVANTLLWIRTYITNSSGRWLMHKIGQRFESEYLSAYRQAHGPLEHLDAWLAVHAARLMDDENRSRLAFYEQIVRSVLPDW